MANLSKSTRIDHVLSDFLNERDMLDSVRYKGESRYRRRLVEITADREARIAEIEAEE